MIIKMEMGSKVGYRKKRSVRAVSTSEAGFYDLFRSLWRRTDPGPNTY